MVGFFQNGSLRPYPQNLQLDLLVFLTFYLQRHHGFAASFGMQPQLAGERGREVSERLINILSRDLFANVARPAYCGRPP
ncbi:hypothetical protein FPV16_22905 [Methylobacterium sp. W2]|uniref:hypothetical protein n=1 Tax=Methylobacterium sp. W2 TaxID=2598107 RepID=UPI001D0C27DD|nr:hypothetical protein [Methylobacterium sp. W2]MCC0809015.1 hypothetical protein [Methylobacterium sp. W2]